MSDRLADIEAKRAARRAEIEAARDEQKAADLEAIFEIEAEHGDTNVSHIQVAHVPGLPVLIAVRCPTPAELKRYRARCKPTSDGKMPDTVAAAEELAAACRVYPSAELYARIGEARPGAHVLAGFEALKLAGARAADEGKG